MNIQESSREDSAKFNFLEIIWESKTSWRVHFQDFGEPEIQNVDNHGAISMMYWGFYKPPVFNYSEVGTYAYLL